MTQENIMLPVGASLQDSSGARYRIEGLLGRGGFGAVYLVSDRSDKNRQFALKEVIEPSEDDRKRLLFECEILKKLVHPALPHVYHVFESEKLKRVYLLMEYIKGKNLEVLREEQPDKRFPLKLVLSIMVPIVNALIFLHHQEPPILHRDIKPDNIIVPMDGREAVLVDFGTAKEFLSDSTTTVFRHGSPGYAPIEQYSPGSRTNLRTDVYGLGATMYTLLTGVTPPDAITRLTTESGADSLKPVSAFVPDIPKRVNDAIQGALSIYMQNRFATVEEFWMELTDNAPQQQLDLPAKTGLDIKQPITLPEQDYERTRSEQIRAATRALADTPSKVDLLGFSDYAEALADFIRNEETEKPLTIAIDAAWGMGKTTLMKMIKVQLEQQQESTNERPFPMVWFNAWKYDQEGSLGAALVLEILDQVRKQFTMWQWIRFWWKLNWKRFDWELLFESILKSVATISAIVLLGILGIILFILVSHWPGEQWFESTRKVLLPIANILGVFTVLTIGKKVYDQVALPFDLKIAKYVHEPNYKDRVGFLAQFEEDFKSVIEVVTEEGKWPLIVFIDDLDRCSPPKPVEIVEAINGLLDAKYCVFVVGMDVQTVAASIEAKYKDIQSSLNYESNAGGLTLGQRFLEKVVQISFHIPRVDEKMTGLFIDTMLEMLKENRQVNPLTREIKKTEGLSKVRQDITKSPNVPVRTAQAVNSGIKAGMVTSPRGAYFLKYRQAVNSGIKAGKFHAQKEEQNKFAQSIDNFKDVRSAIHAVASYLERNPRKIKRFINIFRLQALIANRRGLLQTGEIHLGLLAKWLIIVTRWPHAVEAIIADQNFVKRLKEANEMKELLRESLKSDNDFLSSADGKRSQAVLNQYLEDPYIKWLIDATDLMNLLRQMTEIEIELISYYPYLTQSTTVIPEGKSVPDILIG